MKIKWLLIAGVVAALGFLFTSVYFGVRDAETRQGCDVWVRYVASQCRKCESAGGIFTAGGWGSPNCAFPPSAPL